MKENLAIIIPAFKHQFLSQTLESIVNQTCKKFNLYIGDDASPYDLKSIIEPFEKQLPIRYKRFEKNLGMDSLTRQWNRCIDLSENEEFIWLFSDDDIMPVDAVERFYNEMVINDQHNLFRFNLQFIDKKNIVIRDSTSHPRIESSQDFLKRRLLFSTLSSACEYIFRRQVYKENNGFVEFPLAWCSDDATWAVFGRQSGIITLPGRPISLRMSAGLNISSDPTNKKIKFVAVIAFVNWIHANFRTEIDSKYYYFYIRSQINTLTVTFANRPAILMRFVFFLNPLLLLALIINRSIIYRTVDRLFNFEIAYE